MVDAGVVMIRLKSEKHPYRTPMLLLAYTILAFVASLCYTRGWSVIAALTIGAVACLPLMLLCFEPHVKDVVAAEAFKCPFVRGDDDDYYYFNSL